MKARRFYEHTFDFTVHLLVPCTPKQLDSYVLKEAREEIDTGEWRGICVTYPTDVIIGLSCWKRDAQWIAILSHEITHGVTASLIFRDIELSHYTTEVFSLLQESLLRRCLQLLGVK